MSVELKIVIIVIMIMITVISTAPYLTDTDGHTALYKICKNCVH